EKRRGEHVPAIQRPEPPATRASPEESPHMRPLMRKSAGCGRGAARRARSWCAGGRAATCGSTPMPRTWHVVLVLARSRRPILLAGEYCCISLGVRERNKFDAAACKIGVGAGH